MPGNSAPERKRSRSGNILHKYNELRKEHTEFKKKVSEYQGAVYELAKSASISARRIGMLTQTVVALRKHIAFWPHDATCVSSPSGVDGENDTPCNCGHDAILASIDKCLNEPDFDPGNVKVEIKEAQPESVPLAVIQEDEHEDDTFRSTDP